MEPIEIIRRALLNAKISRYEISKRTGVDQATLLRFRNGTVQDLRTSTAARLCKALGLELIVRKARRPGRR